MVIFAAVIVVWATVVAFRNEARARREYFADKDNKKKSVHLHL